jgi:uncharacterized membrane protein (UPF0127 family)
MTALARTFTPLLVALCCALPAACDSSSTQPASNLPTVTMAIAGKPFTLEVADNERDRMKGLMERDSMPADHGMLFVFSREAPLGFWMKNTRIPLDILYIDSGGKVVSVKQMKPYDRSSTPSDGDAQYAIELNEGTAKRLGIEKGATLTLPIGLKAKD